MDEEEIASCQDINQIDPVLTLCLIMDRFVSTAYKLQSGIILHDLLLEGFFKSFTKPGKYLLGLQDD